MTFFKNLSYLRGIVWGYQGTFFWQYWTGLLYYLRRLWISFGHHGHGYSCENGRQILHLTEIFHLGTSTTVERVTALYLRRILSLSGKILLTSEQLRRVTGSTVTSYGAVEVIFRHSCCCEIQIKLKKYLRGMTWTFKVEWLRVKWCQECEDSLTFA